jgi:hypothetical protein
MYSTMCLLILHVYGANIPSPNWNRDYGLALREAKEANKPLAVFIASGKDGWRSVCKEKELNWEVCRLLTDKYVCVYVDGAEPVQQELARSFEASPLPLLVLSDHSRAYQAYRHSGVLANTNLAQLLQRYASAEAFAAQRDEAAVRPAGPVYAASEVVPCRS